jgi:hypothetical protein
MIPILSTQPNPVTLNLFQVPSCRKPRGPVGMPSGAILLPNNASACAEKWTLKQVQGDDEGEGRA